MVGRLFQNGEAEKVDPGEKVRQCVVDFNQCDKQLRIAYLGSPGHGKSSTQNSASAYTCNPPRVKQVARAGCGEGNITKDFTEHALEVWDPSSGKNVQSSIIMVDTPGKLCKDLKLEYERLEHSPRREETITGMILEEVVWPLQRAGATALVAVVSAEHVWKEAKRNMTQFERLKGGPLQIPHDSVVHESLQILRKILSTGGDRCMRPICIVTHVDVADKAVGRDLHKLPTSSKIKRITAYVSSQLGLNLNLVHPMVNLRNEFDPASNMELGRVALTTFRHVLQAAEDGYNERAANEVPPPPPAAPEVDNIKANRHTELHMLRCMGHGSVVPL